MRKKSKLNIEIQKNKKNKIKIDRKNKKQKSLDFKIRFNLLTFLTYICRNNNSFKIIFFTNYKWYKI